MRPSTRITAVALLILIGPALARSAENGQVRTADLSPAAERAIDAGLRWLAGQQNADGSWGLRYHEASTAVALMALMLKGHFPETGPYGEAMDKGVAFLIERARRGGGYMGVNMYEHGLATLALSEVWGMSERNEIRDTLKRAVEVILRAQSPKGGWRYEPRPRDADISVTVMQIVALASAREAGIHVPSQTIDKALRYVKGLQVHGSGGFGYTGPSHPEFARSAAGVMALLMCGDRDSREVLMGLEYLRQLPPGKFTAAKFYYYGHYYAAWCIQELPAEQQGIFQAHMAKLMMSKQEKDGSWWDYPFYDYHQQYGTAYAVLTLLRCRH